LPVHNAVVSGEKLAPIRDHPGIALWNDKTLPAVNQINDRYLFAAHQTGDMGEIIGTVRLIKQMAACQLRPPFIELDQAFQTAGVNREERNSFEAKVMD
ncbi:hypothetical protein MXD62_10610, partial [Frankia sp. Mgl5]